jgi:GTP-binding protein Era|tara:strand:+ start:74 stop:985 length:912 start_codon:yes stop_codon:yes gene_type:complete
MNKERAGFIALIGEPNVGKSTLLNKMVGSKVSIVTHKVQTTRARVRGIAVHDNSQLVFVDTPGLFETKRRLDRAMVASAWGGARDADIVALLVSANKSDTEGFKKIIEKLTLEVNAKRVILVLNKIDRTNSDRILHLVRVLNDYFAFEETFMVSATKGHGLPLLKNWLANNMPEGPWLYPVDQIADLPLKVIAADITREKLILRLHQELPYQLTVETEKWIEKEDGSVLIEQLIYVIRDGHKGIILGKKGLTIKNIGQESRLELIKFLGMNVHLLLKVKVRPNWQDESARYSQIGLNFNDGNS